ncbi:MAG TPA: PEGA domain-containing protein [Candidatus Sulfotelmatobacter sp.]|nr:PEGA domain-containing protein [Candidatus Sulfotelmatobacter sp.]
MRRLSSMKAALLILAVVLSSTKAPGQGKIQGELAFDPATKVEKTSGVWIDGQYVGYIGELKDDKKILLLPGSHEVSVRQSGYVSLTQTVTIEPGKRLVLHVRLDKDPRVQYSKVSSEIKLQVTPDRAAVFLDDNFVGTVHEFGGVGRAMLVSPGTHRVKIALPGYREFQTEVTLLLKQKFTIKTDLVPGSITQAGPLIKEDEK